MRVYQLNHENVLCGYTQADPSPLEEGVWLIPGNCVSIEPPEFGVPNRARRDWEQEEWIIEPTPEPDPEPELPEPIVLAPIDKIRAFLLNNPDVADLLKEPE